MPFCVDLRNAILGPVRRRTPCQGALGSGAAPPFSTFCVSLFVKRGRISKSAASGATYRSSCESSAEMSSDRRSPSAASFAAPRLFWHLHITPIL